MNFKEYISTIDEVNSLSIIGEAFNTPVPVAYKPTVVDGDNTYIDGSFEVQGNKFTITFEILEQYNAIQVNFAQIENGKRLHNDTNNLSKAQTFSVFSTIIAETKKKLKARNYSAIFFTATSPKKLSVYRRIIQDNLSDGYNVAEDGRTITLFKSKELKSSEIDIVLSNFKDKYK